MAIVLVALVPTFLYVLTSENLLRYRLELQEVVVASPWDYTHLDYEPAMVPGEALVSNLRQGYDDLNSAADNRNIQPSLMTFATWNKQNGQDGRVVCAQNNGLAADISSTSSARALSQEVNHGGLYTCRAALEVVNVQLVNEFFKEWSAGVQVTDRAQNLGVWELNQQHFSVLADTWAMTKVVDINPREAGMLKDRVNRVYQGADRLGGAVAQAERLAQAGQRAGVIRANIITQDMGAYGDNTRNGEVGFSMKAPPRVPGNEVYDASPWRQQGAQTDTSYEQAHKTRQSFYMGRDVSDW